MNATTSEDPELAAFLDEVLAFHRRQRRTLLPLSPSEIGELERELGRQLPRCLHAVLTAVGLLTNPFKLLARQRDWVDALAWLPPAAAASKPPWEVGPQNLVAFADPSGSSDYLLLACDDHFGHCVFDFQHDEGSLTPTKVTLLDSLAERWQTTRRDLEHLAFRQWSVQFSVSARSDDQANLVVARIAGLGNAANPIAPQWAAQFLKMPEGVRWPTTPVTHYEAQVRLGNQLITVRKERPFGSAESKVVFTLSDPETELESGFIASARQVLRDLDVRFAECDYGLLFPIADERRPTSC